MDEEILDDEIIVDDLAENESDLIEKVKLLEENEMKLNERVNQIEKVVKALKKVYLTKTDEAEPEPSENKEKIMSLEDLGI